MSREQRPNSQGGDSSKRQCASQLSNTHTPSTPASSRSMIPPLLQLPAAVLGLVFLHLPWYERLLHVGHVHRQLPPSWLLWAESDHVRLTASPLSALEVRSPSALHCCRHVVSLSVDVSMDDAVLLDGVHEGEVRSGGGREADDVVELERDYVGRSWHPSGASRLQQCVELLQQRGMEQQQRQQQSATALPFSNVRFLVASPSVFRQLLDCTGLTSLHSLSLHASHYAARNEREEQAEARCVGALLSRLPALRRLRVDRMAVAYRDLLSIAGLEVVDVRNAGMMEVERDEASGIVTSPALSLQRLQLASLHNVRVDGLLASLVATSLQQLRLRARLTNDDLHSLTTLKSLTALELHVCYFEDINALGCLVSDEGEPLLPALRSFAIDNCRTAAIDVDNMRTCTAAFLTAYSRQLRHITLVVTAYLHISLAAVLTVIVSHMPQLETLELAVTFGDRDSSEVVEAIVVGSRAGQQQQQTPTMHSLRSLTLRNLPMSDAAVAQLLSYCPHLLELTIDRVAPLTAAVWSSVLRCRQLLSLCFHSASLLASESNGIQAASSSSSSSAVPSSVTAFPSLVHLSLAFPNSIHVDPAGFTCLLRLFAGSPIRTLALRLPHTLDRRRYLRHLAMLPCLARLLCKVEWRVVDEREHEHEAGDGQHSVADLLERCTDEAHCTHDQHHVSMQHYWQDGLPDERDELVEKYRAGVKLPYTWPHHNTDRYRVFKPARSEHEEDGRLAFFRGLREGRVVELSSSRE